ncbi:kinetochore protein Sos7 [Podospora fimiseda]|uniref:Kinetochore protein Sos7 n=1 Tax=Podospora fimiseda TaxID=252190 RepID=A0AAN7H8F7_9PEZI|nr:kinetochore protein Sos7 [Podospora fimiseda]
MPRANSPPETTVQQRAAKVLKSIKDLQSASGDDELTIIKISEPISSAVSNPVVARTSDVSTSSLNSLTPSSLEADLLHYKELFAKLRFSYVEQVTKEKFIRAIVGDPPLIVTPQENADLESSNAEAKAALKQLKTQVADMVAALETRSKNLVQLYERIQADTAQLQPDQLPNDIATLEKAIESLRSKQKDSDGKLPLGETLRLVSERRREVADLDRQLAQLGPAAPRKRKEAERLQQEVVGLDNKRANSTAAAREAKRRKENSVEGGGADELEAQGRWFRGADAILRSVLDIPAGQILHFRMHVSVSRLEFPRLSIRGRGRSR